MSDVRSNHGHPGVLSQQGYCDLKIQLCHLYKLDLKIFVKWRFSLVQNQILPFSKYISYTAFLLMASGTIVCHGRLSQQLILRHAGKGKLFRGRIPVDGTELPKPTFHWSSLAPRDCTAGVVLLLPKNCTQVNLLNVVNRLFTDIAL